MRRGTNNQKALEKEIDAILEQKEVLDELFDFNGKKISEILARELDKRGVEADINKYGEQS